MGENVPYDIEDHPDLKDAAWLRAANRRAKREIRRQRRQARMHRHGRTVVIAVALVAVGAAVFGLYKAGTFSQAALPQALVPTITTQRQGVDVEHPFAGTPAEQWADGEKGIVVPDQNPEYAAGYEAARKALVVGHLDPRVLVDHDVEPFVSMLAPSLRDAWRNNPNNGSVVTRLKKGNKLLPNGIKVDGRMWPGRDQYGRPLVHTSYRFAYAFDPGYQKSIFDQYEIVALVRSDTDYQLAEDGVWTVASNGFLYSMACEASKQGFLAPLFTEKRQLPTAEEAKRKPEEWFAADTPIPTTSGCK
ncbi:hypothetical protein ACWEIJ_39155 [Lentzea sp. NPDC004789]